MDVLRTSSAESIQTNEAVALEAIFGDAFKVIEATNQTLKCFEITLVPHPGVSDDNHSSVKMKVLLPANYPLVSPIVTFERIKGLSDVEMDELNRLIKDKLNTELGGQNREVVFDLTQVVEDFLQQHNLPPQSLHDQMVARQKAQEREARERLLLKQRQEMEEAMSFETDYQQKRMRSLMDGADNPEDVYSVMGKEVFRAMSYRKPPKSRAASGKTSRSSPSPHASGHLLSIGSGSESDSFGEGEGYSTDESSASDHNGRRQDLDSNESDEDFGFEASTLLSTNARTAGRRGVDLRRATRGGLAAEETTRTQGAGKRLSDASGVSKTAASTVKGPGKVESDVTGLNRAGNTKTGKAQQTLESSRRENTFFRSPVGLEWDDYGDADSDEYEDADKTKGPRATSDSVSQLRQIARVQRSMIKWVNPRELVPSKTCKLYKAIDVSTEKSIVVKEYTLPSLDNAKTDLLENLCEKISRASRSISHEHLVRYLGADYRPESNGLFVLRDFCAGDVSTVLRSRPLDEPKIRNYVLQIVSCISYLHGRGIYGLNIKANNMLLDNQGKLKLADYIGSGQISAILNPNWKGSGENWWSPEATQQARSEREEDLVNLGLTMIELATGSRSRPGLPSNFTSHAQNFCQSCLSPNGHTISELKCHPFVAFDEEETTQGEFVPLSPASSAPGFHPFLRPGERLGSFDSPETQGSFPSTNWSSSSPSQPLNNSNSTTNASSDAIKAFQNIEKIQSRYRLDFEELEVLGKGGFGQVVKARNRLDDNLYAIKKIRFGRTDAGFVEKLKREVMTLSRLNHPHVVRYFNAWIGDADEEDMFITEEDDEMDEEDEEDDIGITIRASDDDDDDDDDEDDDDDTSDDDSDDEDEDDENTLSLVPEDENDLFDQSLAGRTFDETLSFDEDRLLGLRGMLSMSRTGRMKSKRGKRNSGKKNRPDKSGVKPPSKILYIQMEYCTEKTLKHLIDERSLSDDMKWKLFRQVVEGLHHIHAQGIIHRDLKPTNVFIDSSGDIKIGDFGLAVTSGGSSSSSRSDSISLANSRQASAGRNPINDGLTTGVGTPLYLAPEQDRPGAFYNQKVDIYSLGIIFFELFTNFSTAMERYQVIKDLRTKEIKVPPAWEKDPIKCKLVRWMLSHDPEDRPSTITLLQSELLPVKLEDETLNEAMRSITMPNTTMHSLLLKRLFGVPSDPTTDLSFDLETSLKNPYEAVLKQNATRRLIKIFEIHAADYVEPAAFFPRPSLYLNPHAVQFLSPTGTVISVPFDLTMPFARYVAHRNIRNMRRYVFGKVYRATTGQPREMNECDFDVVGPMSNRLAMTSEVIQVLVEILNEFRDELGRSVVRFTNFKVLDAIIGRISESFDVQKKIRGVLAQFWRKHSPKETEKLLLNIEGVTSKALESVKMEMLLHISKDLTCPAMDTLTKIEGLYPRDKVIQETLRETKQFLHYAELFRIVSHLRFDITLIYNYEYYYDIMFQGFLLSGDVIAAGGCYDSVVEHFATQADPGLVWSAASSSSAPFGRNREKRAARSRSAVGINIALDNLVNRIWEHKRSNEDRSIEYTASAQIVVFSHMRQPTMPGVALLALEERIQVVQLLWKHKLPAEYSYDESWTLEMLTRDCEVRGTQWIVIIKETKNSPASFIERKTPIRVKDVRLKTETAMTVGDLPSFFASRVSSSSSLGDSGDYPSSSTAIGNVSRTASGGARGKATSATRLSIDSGSAPVDPNQFKTAEPDSLDVEIIGPLRQEKGAKGKRDIVKAASDKISPLLRNFAPKTVIKVGAVDIPLPQIREVLVVLEAGGDIGPLERKLVKVKDRIPHIKDYWVKVRRDKHPYAFFYSIIDEDFQMSFLKR